MKNSSIDTRLKKNTHEHKVLDPWPRLGPSWVWPKLGEGYSKLTPIFIERKGKRERDTVERVAILSHSIVEQWFKYNSLK